MEMNPYIYRATIVHWVDGDTVDVDIDLGFDVVIKERVRLLNINAPEIRTRDADEKSRGYAAARFAEDLMPVGSARLMRTVYDRRGKFGRVLGDLWVHDDNCWLTDLMVDRGHAERVEY